MAIQQGGVSPSTVGELLDQNLRIPHYQRPYVWAPRLALRLLHDIQEALARPPAKDGSQAPYVLGAVILHSNEDHFDIVDGQQRLLTLRMLLRILDGEDTAAPTVHQEAPVVAVWNQLHAAVTPLDRLDRNELARFIRTKCQVVRIETDDIDEAFRVFDSQNYRGQPLAPHDLLKAHHLRDMRDDSAATKAAVVEQWESAGHDALNELFSTYLYRIAKWTRGERPGVFTANEIDEFKGITTQHIDTPNFRYHLAAQSVLPLMRAWQSTSTEAMTRDANRARFQLDAPILAGRGFFEMVEFMLLELEWLKDQPFPRPLRSAPASREEDAPLTFRNKLAQSRYRRVTELYLASLLYYVNKFGQTEMERASNHLFDWAYDLRLAMLRVMQVSVDIAGAKPNSPFVLLRHARDGNAVSALSPSRRQPRGYESHELELLAILTGGRS